jgi:gliding motility-associated-like protein
MRKILRGHVLNKNILFTLCLGLSFLGKAHAQVSGTFTINPGLPASTSNFQTFSAAVASLSGGVNGPVTFNVEPSTGPYNEQIILNSIAGTSATNTITFNCNGATLTFLSTNTNQRAGVKLKNTSYVTFDNLTVVPQADEASEFGYGFHLLNDADHNTIKNCRINGVLNTGLPLNNEGIVINGSDMFAMMPGDCRCDDNLIQLNTITGVNAGITLNSRSSSATPAFINGNKVTGNTISNCYSAGIITQYTTNTLVDKNDITGGPTAVFGNAGIQVLLYNQSLSVTRNSIHGFTASAGAELYGIKLSSESEAGKECVIANNLIYDLQSDGSQYGIGSKVMTSSTSASFLKIYNNTISLDDQNIHGYETYGLFFENATDLNVTNNIISISRGTDFRNYGAWFENKPVNYTGSNNVYYLLEGASVGVAVGWFGSGVSTDIEQWRKATGAENYSLRINPAYANLAGGDLRPTAQLIDNMAIPLTGVANDINGIARHAVYPDPGCLEFNSATCSTPVVAGSAGVMGDSILCLGPKVQFNLAGNSAGATQTYTWESSSTQTGGYTAITGAQGYPVYEVIPTTTKYYRVAVACGSVTAYSAPIRVLVNSGLNSGTYTINNALPTGGINFNSFRDAVFALQCGLNGSVVFNVASGSGPYNEQVVIPVINTSKTKTVTFNGNGATLIYKATDWQQSAAIRLDGADYVTIDSLNVVVQDNPVTENGFGIQLINDADYNTIKRCKVSLNTTSSSLKYAGIVINSSLDVAALPTLGSFCDTNSIINNTVTGGFYGISCASNSGSLGLLESFGNIIKGNTLIDNAGYGIYVTGQGFSEIDSNDISQPARTVVNTAGFNGIYIFQQNWGLKISRNKVHDILTALKNTNIQIIGINITGCTTDAANPNVTSNNLIYNFKGNGWQYGLYSSSSNYVKYYHNTISLEDTAATGSFTSRGFGYVGSSQPGVEFKNNNVTIHRGKTGDGYCVHLSFNDATALDYNNYYAAPSGGTGVNRVAFMASTTYPTLSNWQASGRDAHSIAVDPVYNDLAKGDLTPTKIPTENKGSNVGVTIDANNVARNTATPDIGAIEYTICRALTAPALTVEESSINTVTFKWTAVQGTSGYRVSRDGINWTIPSSGAMGTSHVVVGLNPTDSVYLLVKALGARVDCPEYLSAWKGAQAQTDQVFIPNTFSPNNNNVDDYFKVYSTVMKTMHLMVFNQWGVKVFETNDPEGMWDGNYKGKPQPVGVYVYVVTGALNDGSKVNQKGTFNLIR